MIFSTFRESEEEVEKTIDDLTAAEDPDSAEGIKAMAKQVEDQMRSAAIESLVYFDNGEDAVKHITESSEFQALFESRKMAKKTFVRLNKNDDLIRRSHLACLILAKNNNDPLWHKLADNRIKEKKLRNAIYQKYGEKAKIIARKSQQVHIKNAKKLPDLPKIQF